MLLAPKATLPWPVLFHLTLRAAVMQVWPINHATVKLESIPVCAEASDSVLEKADTTTTSLCGSTYKVEYVARRAGYSGLANFYTVFERQTGPAPSRVRALEPAALRWLLEHKLEISLVALFEAPADRPAG